MSDLKISKQAGATGGAGETIDQTTTYMRKDGVYQTPSTSNQVQNLNAGTSTASSAPVLTPTFAASTPAQLSDTSRDYMVYLECTTAGTALVVKIGPTSTPANTIIASSTATLGELITIRLPAGWYLSWAASTALFATQTAIGC